MRCLTLSGYAEPRLRKTRGRFICLRVITGRDRNSYTCFFRIFKAKSFNILYRKPFNNSLGMVWDYIWGLAANY
jgi:hypothetical protein